MNQVSVASTISGMVSLKHPTHCVLCREDGAFLRRKGGNYTHWKPYEIPHSWVFGSNRNGYRQISLCKKIYSAHRIICEVFHDNPENKPTVDHIDRNPSNNRADNLRWATSKEQRENSSAVINRLPYSVRACENKLLYDKEYRADHREEKREYNRQYSKRNIEHIRELKRNYYAAHREQCAARARKYCAEHPEYVKAMSERKKAKYRAEHPRVCSEDESTKKS